VLLDVSELLGVLLAVLEIVGELELVAELLGDAPALGVLLAVGIVTFPTVAHALIAPLAYLAFTTLEGHFITLRRPSWAAGSHRCR
jgi:hypothetical protein